MPNSQGLSNNPYPEPNQPNSSYCSLYYSFSNSFLFQFLFLFIFLFLSLFSPPLFFLYSIFLFRIPLFTYLHSFSILSSSFSHSVFLSFFFSISFFFTFSFLYIFLSLFTCFYFSLCTFPFFFLYYLFLLLTFHSLSSSHSDCNDIPLHLLLSTCDTYENVLSKCNKCIHLYRGSTSRHIL